VGKTILVFAVIIVFASCAWSGEKRREDYVRFFAGVAMLRSGGNLSADSTAVLYRELLALSGVTTKGAVEFLEKSKRDPIKWKEFHDSVILAVTEQFTTK